MANVVMEITMSLDGYAAGPNDSASNPLGEGGKRLHYWLFEGAGEGGNAIDQQAASEFFANMGAVILGRRTFDLGINEWGDDGAFGMPCFVLTGRPHETVIKGPTTFNFVTDGIESALKQAKAAAGEKDVMIMGGSKVMQQYVRAGLVDEIRLHIVPVLMGVGVRLFENIGITPIELEQTHVVQSLMATHLKYRVKR